MERPKTSVSRALVGGLAAILLLSAAVLTFWPGMSRGSGPTWRAGCTRVGIVLAAYWLAMPTRNRPAAWANLSFVSLIAAALAILALLRVPFRFLVPLAAVLLVLGLISRPKKPARPQRPQNLPPR